MHPDLDPRGVFMRECRDSEEHPFSTPIAVLFDATTWMGDVLLTGLPRLPALLTGKGYAIDPQVMVGAIGDRAPLQVGRFGSDEDLAKIALDSGGGRRSYELALYFMARHTILDSMINRGRRGYLFIVGDEMPDESVRSREVAEVIGDRLREDLRTEDIVRELQRKYEIFFISAGAGEEALTRWRELLGPNVLELDDLGAVCETIALTVGLGEDALELNEGIAPEFLFRSGFPEAAESNYPLLHELNQTASDQARLT